MYHTLKEKVIDLNSQVKKLKLKIGSILMERGGEEEGRYTHQ